jgi:hypothetical protein
MKGTPNPLSDSLVSLFSLQPGTDGECRGVVSPRSRRTLGSLLCDGYALSIIARS